MRDGDPMTTNVLRLVLKGCVLISLLGIVEPVVYANGEKNTVFRIIATDSSGQTKRGTGFVVSGYNYIITAYHVVQNSKQIDIDRPDSTPNLAVILCDPKNDIALLELPEKMMPKVIPFKAGNLNASSKVTLLGYGSIVDQLQEYPGTDLHAPFILSQEWNKPQWRPGKSVLLFDVDNVKLLMIQAMFPYGVSGGPVINAAGEVIGVISGAYARMDEYVCVGWAIAIEYALKDVSHQHRLQAADVVWTPEVAGIEGRVVDGPTGTAAVRFCL